MIINDIYINAELMDILNELRSQLAINRIPLMQTLRDSGNNIMCSCPYHNNGQERKPSAGIRKDTGIFHCFACHEVHTLPEVISFCFGYTNDMFGKQGMKWILKNFASAEIEERQDVEIDMERNHTSNKSRVLDSSDSNQSVPFVSEEELDSYRYEHSYWKQRGITSKYIIELFDLGYDIKNACVTFPVRDFNGNCLFVAKRSVKTKWFNYPKDIKKPLYGLYEIKLFDDKWVEAMDNIAILPPPNYDDMFITESMIDAILLWQAGNYAFALNGTGNELQFAQLRQFPTRHYILCTDNDEAGMKARERIRKNVPNKLFSEIMFPPTIKDVGDLGKAGRFEDIVHIRQWEEM